MFMRDKHITYPRPSVLCISFCILPSFIVPFLTAHITLLEKRFHFISLNVEHIERRVEYILQILFKILLGASMGQETVSYRIKVKVKVTLEQTTKAQRGGAHV